jgi:hypothetical protein
MQQRESAADRTVREIAVSLATHAEVLLSAGAPQNAALLKDRVEAAAKAASIRLYPQFDTADNRDWETVVKHGQAGNRRTFSCVSTPSRVVAMPSELPNLVTVRAIAPAIRWIRSSQPSVTIRGSQELSLIGHRNT